MNEVARRFSVPIDIEAVISGTARLDRDQAMCLYHEATLHELGRWSSEVCERLHGPLVRTFVKDRNINYTNICSARCTFCAFRRDGDEADAYTLDRRQLHDKIRELIDVGGTQILLQGGMNPDLGIEFYEDMLRGIKLTFPAVHIHGFSPPEFVEFVAVLDIAGFESPGAGRSNHLPLDVWRAKLEAIMARLATAGLDSLPGGGGEIFAEHVRRRIGLGKASARQWLEVMACAHRLGMRTSATMMFGHIESRSDRVDHMLSVREWQDRAIAHNWPGRYVSFISWPFQRENTPLGRVPEWDPMTEDDFPGDTLAEAIYHSRVDSSDKMACDQVAPRAGKFVRMVRAAEYLRTQALSRLVLDNIASIGSSWVTMGPHIGQMGLFFGANDMGSIMMEENVVSAAGTTYRLDEQVLCHLIRGGGFTPAQRDNSYRILCTYDGPDSPDLRVTDWSRHRAGSPSATEHADDAVAVPLTIAAE